MRDLDEINGVWRVNKLKGLYFCKENSTELIKIDTTNLSECINMIYDKCNDKDRINTILNSMIEVSGMSLDTMLENNSRYKKDYEDILKEISDTWFITSAYNKAPPYVLLHPLTYSWYRNSQLHSVKTYWNRKSAKP